MSHVTLTLVACEKWFKKSFKNQRSLCLVMEKIYQKSGCHRSHHKWPKYWNVTTVSQVTLPQNQLKWYRGLTNIVVTLPYVVILLHIFFWFSHCFSQLVCFGCTVAQSGQSVWIFPALIASKLPHCKNNFDYQAK